MIVIPMAGKSSRFYKAGFTLPKFMLPFKNKTIFEEAVCSFEKYFETDFFLFITRDDDGSEEFVSSKCIELNIKYFEIYSINYDTKGQAETISIGLNNMIYKSKKNEPIYIFNIDSIRVNFTKQTSKFLENISGYLEVFVGDGDHWSFIEPSSNNFVKRTTEKIRISDLCSNGLYYFYSITLFNETFERYKTINNYNELYVAPMYNLLIENNLLVKYVLLEKNETIFSGTPEEYEDLIRINK